MRIIHIFSAPISAYFFMEKQLQFMIEKGCEIHVIIPNDNFFSEKFKKREPNVNLHYVSIKREVSLFSDIHSLFKIFNLLIKIKGDILHLHTPKASLIGAMAGRLAFQKNIIYQMHGLVSANGHSVNKDFVYYLEKLTCFLSTKVFAVSNSLRLFAIENNYCKKTKISVIGNGTINGIDWENKFNPKKIDKASKYLPANITKGKFIIGYIGRISEDKGIEDYLMTFNYLKDKIPALGVIVGPNESGMSIENLLQKHKLSLELDNLLIFDQIFDPQNVMYHFDVLLFPTKREGFGLVAAEANSLKVPVVAYDIPGVKDAIEHNSTGKLVKYGNIEELGSAILEYYKNNDIRLEHGNNGRERIKKLFTQEYLWHEIYKTYKSLSS